MRGDGSATEPAGTAGGQRGLTALWGEARALGGVLLCAACAGAAYGIRYGFVEPEALGAACERDQPWWCPIRTAFIMFTEWYGFGWLALVLAAGAVACLLPLRLQAARRFATAALIAGGFGMVLYNATYSVIGAVVAALCLIRAR